MQKKIALLYDFDYTLTPKYSEEYGLMQKLGYNDIWKFFDGLNASLGDANADYCLSLMYGILYFGRKNNIKITKKFFEDCGKDIEFFPGVKTWFKAINDLGKKYGYKIEHYIISSCMQDLINGCKIAKEFKRIYANMFAYDKDGVACWPSHIVNYTTKTQYIYRVRKKALDYEFGSDKVNKHLGEDVELPFKQMIYFGDSDTDIPAFKTLKSNGGQSICVYKSGDLKSKNIARKCFKDGRVNFFAPADYTVGSELYNYVASYIEKIIKDNEENN